MLWRDIISHNAVATTEALDDLIACLLDIRGAVADGDWNAVEAAVALGRRRKAVMENVRWGPGRWAEEEWPLSELTTRVLAAGAAGQALRSAGSASEGRVQVLVHAQNLPNAGS